MKLIKKSSEGAEILEIRPSNYTALIVYCAFLAICIVGIAFLFASYGLNFTAMLGLIVIAFLLCIPAIYIRLSLKKQFVRITKKGDSIELSADKWPLASDIKSQQHSFQISEIEAIGNNEAIIYKTSATTRPWILLKSGEKKPLWPWDRIKISLSDSLYDPWQFSQEEIKQVAEFVGVPFREKKGLLEQAKEKLSKAEN
ncbi:MAG: hypothetical protein NT067_00070 [Candidatus Diapherotrites archaeon]|nr:hypothetical protein [Candidatus Diapherotrites archaeon]